MTLALLTFVAVFMLVASGVVLLFYRGALLARLSNVVTPSSSEQGLLERLFGGHTASSIEQAVDPIQRLLPRTPEEVGVVQKRLILAGYRKDSYVNIFYAVKVAVPVLLVVLVTVTKAYNHFNPIIVYALAGGLGFLLPDFWLGNRISARQLKIRLGLPEVLDLMVICVEAGLGLDQAMLRVADELKVSQPVLADELNLVNLEQRAGRSRADAWRNLAERTDVDSVRALVAMLIQTDSFGTSIAKALRIHSDGLRTQRRQQAEEEAAKTTVKLVFPLVFFIFPSLFLVVLGPSLITIQTGFENLFQK